MKGRCPVWYLGGGTDDSLEEPYPDNLGRLSWNQMNPTVLGGNSIYLRLLESRSGVRSKGLSSQGYTGCSHTPPRDHQVEGQTCKKNVTDGGLRWHL